MPIYEYQCDGCQHKMDAFQKSSERLLRECPQCGEEKLRKLMSATAFHLKGNGWYATDFKGEKPKTDTQENSPQKTDNKDTAATESKTKSAKNEDIANSNKVSSDTTSSSATTN